jgi:hypothetical protein
MWLSVARENPIGYVNEPLTFYRVHETNASRNVEKMREDESRIRDWIMSWPAEDFGEYEHPLELHRAFAHNWACLGTIRTWRGDPQGGRHAYVRSIGMMPLRFKSYLRWLLTFLPRDTFRKLN